MQISDHLISQLPQKTAYFIQNMKQAGFNINRIFTVSKELLGDINGYYGIDIITKHTYHKWCIKRLITVMD